MTNKLTVDQILEGKVTGIQPYGAFVELNKDTQGLVHISEVTHGFVKDINDHLAIGDAVKVKVLDINEEQNKVSLSMRATEEAPKKKAAKPKVVQTIQQDDNSIGFNSLKDKLEEWIGQSKERQKTFKN